MIEAIITDLDGTVLPRGGKISPENLDAFRMAGEKGCLRIIATGRSLYAARKVLPPDFPIDYLVFSSGAGVLDWSRQELLFSRHLDERTTREIAGYLWDYNINFTIQREIPDNHLFYYTDLYPVHEDYKRRLQTYEPFGTPIYSPREIEGEATQFILILDAGQLRLLEEIRRAMSAYSVVRSTSPTDNRAIWLEIFSPEINKGNTCRSLLQQQGISLSHTAGLGNDYNDVDFLDICAEAYLVENAPYRLKPHYKSVTSDRNDGFKEFIQRVLAV